MVSLESNKHKVNQFFEKYITTFVMLSKKLILIMNNENYENMVTRVTRSISMSCGLVDYVHNRILYNMEDGNRKILITGLCTKAYKLGNKINYLLSDAGLLDGFAGQRELEKLRNLTDAHWEAIQELYRAIGQDEYNQQMMNAENCVLSPDWRETAEELLEPFSRLLRG